MILSFRASESYTSDSVGTNCENWNSRASYWESNTRPCVPSAVHWQLLYEGGCRKYGHEFCISIKIVMPMKWWECSNNVWLTVYFINQLRPFTLKFGWRSMSFQSGMRVSTRQNSCHGEYLRMLSFSLVNIPLNNFQKGTWHYIQLHYKLTSNWTGKHEFIRFLEKEFLHI